MSRKIDRHLGARRQNLPQPKLLFFGAAFLAVMAWGMEPAVAQSSPSQNPDFPDLPILQPAVPLSAPVSVPPIDMRVIEELPVQPPVTESPAQAITPTPIEIPVVRSPEPPDVEQPVADVPESEAITEPPFIGEVNTSVVEAPEAPPFIEEVNAPVVEVPVIDEPVVAAPTPAEPIVEVPTINEPIVEAPAPAEPPVATIVPIDPLPTIEADAGPATPAITPPTTTATTSRPTPTEDNFAGEIANATPIAPVIPVIEMPVERVSAVPASTFIVTPAATTNRWPEPIPFGQPLP